MVRMSDAQDSASEAARALAQRRWGDTVVVRAARMVVERADELPLTVRAEVHLATADTEDSDD
jgi:hypothetical protein